MSSAEAAALEGLKQNDYLTVALLTVIAYDYVLTLPREIEYIWNKRWTIVSVLFFLVRYCGLYILIVEFILTWPCKTVSDILTVSRPLVQRYSEGETLYIASIWAFVIWIAASDLVMIFRVWAMFNCSRVVLGVLLTFWSTELILSLLACIMYPKTMTVTVTQVSNLAYCGVTSASVTWAKVSAIPEIVNGAIICILAIFQFVKRALEMYRATKKWHSNRYVSLFAGQSILYFLFVVFFNRTVILVAEGKFETEGWGSIILLPLEYVPAFALMPRFIMSVHALRLNEVQEEETNIVISPGVYRGHRSYPSVLDISNTSNEMVPHDESIPMEQWRLTEEN